MADKDQIVNWLNHAGVSVQKLTLIASDPIEPVYKFTSEDQEYFVKVLSEDKGEVMESVLEKELRINIPKSTLIQKDEYLLVMESACGRPLSFWLPICFLPGLWQHYSKSLLSASEAIGVALRNLHAGTFDSIKPINASNCRMANRLTVGPGVRSEFGEDLIHRLNSLFNGVGDKQLPHVRIHGDPTPHNIFWDPGTSQVGIIDFNLHSSVAIEDLVVFEAGIELMTARLPFSRASQGDKIIDRFRSSYTAKGVHETLSDRTIRILKLAYYTHLLDKHLRHITPDTLRQRLTQWTDRRIIERKVRRLTSNL